jgi:hypothetical protein
MCNAKVWLNSHAGRFAGDAKTPGRIINLSSVAAQLGGIVGPLMELFLASSWDIPTV